MVLPFPETHWEQWLNGTISLGITSENILINENLAKITILKTTAEAATFTRSSNDENVMTAEVKSLTRAAGDNLLQSTSHLELPTLESVKQAILHRFKNHLAHDAIKKGLEKLVPGEEITTLDMDYGPAEVAVRLWAYINACTNSTVQKKPGERIGHAVN
ncbi:MAG: hypothetical protein HC848_06635 [Limnobacter sp.]|nr:hypothetical protein [Limnobacter sp.]